MTRLHPITFRNLSCLAAIAALLPSCVHPGMKLLQMEVQHQGNVVLETMFDTSDSSTKSQIWDAAGRKPFATEVDLVAGNASSVAPLEARLTGPVQITITHGSTVEGQASLEDLTLTRSGPSDDDWHLSTTALGRAKKAAGL